MRDRRPFWQGLRRTALSFGLNAGLFVVSFLFALLLAEVVVRLVAPQQLILLRPDMWQPTDSFGWTPRPNVRTTVNMGERTVHYITDEQGFRVAESGRVEADREVLLLGDSFMEALQVEYEESLAGLIEANSERAFGQRIAVRNGAVGGWDPAQYFNRAQRLLSNHRYDALVVAVFTGNDIVRRRIDYLPPRAPAQRAHFELPDDWSRRELTASLAQPINDFLEVRSHLFILVKKKLRWLAIRTKFSHAYFPQVLLRREAASPRWDLTADILADLADLAGKHGTPTIFLIVPSNVEVETEQLAGYIKALKLDPSAIDAEQPNRLLVERLSARGLPFANTLSSLRAAADRGSTLYGKVDPHLTAAGHAIVWQALQPHLSEMLQSPPRHGITSLTRAR